MSVSRNITITITFNDTNSIQKTNQLKNSVSELTNSVKGTSGVFNAATSSIRTIGDESVKSRTKMQKLGDMFGGNKGLIFGAAGLTSALAEAVGMMGMYGDTADRLHEAQDKLNNLIREGTTSGKEYNDAVSEVTKQQRFFNMVQRNTMLSMMDMLFFGTMVINGIIEMSSKFNGLTGILGKVKSAFTGLLSGGGKANIFSGLAGGASALGNAMTQVEGKAAQAARTTSLVGREVSILSSTATAASGSIGLLGAAIAIAGGALAAVGIIEVAQSINNDLIPVLQKAGVHTEKLGSMLADTWTNNPERVKEIKIESDMMEKYGLSVLDAVFKTEKWNNAIADMTRNNASAADIMNNLGSSIKTAGDLFGQTIEAWSTDATRLQDIKNELDAAFGKGTADPILTGLANISQALVDFKDHVPNGEELKNKLQVPLEEMVKSLGTKATPALKNAVNEIIAISKNLKGNFKDQAWTDTTMQSVKSLALVIAKELNISLEDANKIIKETIKETKDVTQVFSDSSDMLLHWMQIEIMKADQRKKNHDEYVKQMSEMGKAEDDARAKEQAKTRAQMEEQKSLLGLNDIRDTYNKLSVKISQGTENEVKSDLKKINALIDIGKIYKDTRENALLYEAAVTRGRLAAQDFVTQSKLSAVALKAEKAELSAFTTSILGFTPAIELSVDNMHELINAYNDGGKQAQAFAKIVKENLQPSLAGINEILGDDTWKEAKKNIKEMFKDVAPELVKDIQKLEKPLFKLKEAMLGTKDKAGVDDIFGALVKHFREMDTKQVDKFENSMKNLVADMKEIPTDIKDKFTAIIDGLSNLPADKLEQVAPIVTKIIADISKGDFAQAAIDIDEYNKAIGKTSDPTGQAADKTGELATGLDEMGKNIVLALTVSLLADANDDLTLSMAFSISAVELMTKDLPKASSAASVFAKVLVNTAKDADMVTKAVAAAVKAINSISASKANSQLSTLARVLLNVKKDADSAKSSIGSLQSAIDKLKSKSITITQTTVKKVKTVNVDAISNAEGISFAESAGGGGKTTNNFNIYLNPKEMRKLLTEGVASGFSRQL